MIIRSRIPKVVIGMRDPHAKVNGGGIRKLRDAGIDVIEGVLENECRELNKRFVTRHTEERPYIILKWAETADGFIGKQEHDSIVWISNELSRKLVHKWRSEEDAIMVGTTTALQDDPKLNVREWTGKDPNRAFLDFEGKVPATHNLHDGSVPTYIVGRSEPSGGSKGHYIKVGKRSNAVKALLNAMYRDGIQSLIVEGGRKTLDSFINAGTWDEARIFTSEKNLGSGVEAPEISGEVLLSMQVADNRLTILKR